MLKTLASACVLAVLAFTSPPAHAQTVENRTFLTFHQPVTLPEVSSAMFLTVPTPVATTTRPTSISTETNQTRTRTNVAARTRRPQTSPGPMLTLLGLGTLATTMLFGWPRLRR